MPLASVLETCSRCKYYWNTAYSTLSYDRIQKYYKCQGIRVRPIIRQSDNTTHILTQIYMYGFNSIHWDDKKKKTQHPQIISMADPGVQWLVGTSPFLSNALKIAWKWTKNELDCYPFKHFWICRPWICPLNGKCSMILRKSLNFKIVEHSYNSLLDRSITGRRNDVQIHHRHHHVFSSKTLWSFIFIFVGLLGR